MITRYGKLKMAFEDSQMKLTRVREENLRLKEQREVTTLKFTESSANDPKATPERQKEHSESSFSSGIASHRHSASSDLSPSAPIDRNEVPELKGRIKRLDGKLFAIQEECAKKNEKIKSLEVIINERDGKIRQLNGQIGTHLKNIQELKTNAVEMQKKMEKMTAAQQNHSAIIAEIEQKHKAEMLKLFRDHRNISEVLVKDADSEKKAGEELQKMKQECEALKSESAKQTAEFDQIRKKEVEEAEGRCKKQAEQEMHKLRLISMKKFEQKEKDLKSVGDQLNAAINELERLKAESSKAKAEAVEWKAKYEFQPLEFNRKADEANKTWKKTVKQMKEEHQTEMNSIKCKYQEMLKESGDRITQITAELQHANTKGDELQSIAKQQQALISSLRDVLQATQTEVGRLNAEIEAMKKNPSTGHSHQEMEALLTKNRQLEVMLQRMREQEVVVYTKYTEAVTSQTELARHLKACITEWESLITECPSLAPTLQQRWTAHIQAADSNLLVSTAQK